MRKKDGLLFFCHHSSSFPLFYKYHFYPYHTLIPLLHLPMFFNVQSFFECLIGTIQVILVISVSLPIMLLCMAPVVFYFWFVSKQYLKVSRDLKRLESVNKSPVYVLFSGTVLPQHIFLCSFLLPVVHLIAPLVCTS